MKRNNETEVEKEIIEYDVVKLYKWYAVRKTTFTLGGDTVVIKGHSYGWSFCDIKRFKHREDAVKHLKIIEALTGVKK